MMIYLSRNVWLGLVAYTVILALAMVSVPRFINEQYPNLKQDDKIDIRVFSNITRTPDPNRVVIKIFGLGGRYRHITYDMKYTWGDSEYQISTFARPIDVTGNDNVYLDVYLGSCDGKPCKGVEPRNLWVLLEYTDIQGKNIQTGTP